jgi:2-hydroxychromene-2-carboxylate isomerase
MAAVIPLAPYRVLRVASAAPRPRRGVFLFDLASPWTYLAAERVDRFFPGIAWQPALREALHGGDPLADLEAAALERAAAEARAEALRLPLVWPEGPARARAAMRVAALAAEQGRAAAFVLAASRLAYCGGFDLEDPETLAEAAAAAGLGVEEAFEAAGDARRDAGVEAEGRRLLAQGGTCLPAVRVGRALFCGEGRLCDAVAALRGDGQRDRRAVRTR